MNKVEILLLGLFLLAGMSCHFEEHLTSFNEMTPEERKKMKDSVKKKAKSALSRMKKDTEQLNGEADDYFIYEVHKATNGNHIPYRKLNLSSVRRSVMMDSKAQLKKALGSNKIQAKVNGANAPATVAMDSGVEVKPVGRLLAQEQSPFTDKELEGVLGTSDVSKSFKRLIEKTKKAKTQTKVIKKINLS